MKPKLFIYSITDRKISKTYGGSTYYYNVYEVTNDNNLKLVANGHACTRGHKGEDSEAFGALINERPDIKKMLIRKAKNMLKSNPDRWEAKNLLADINNSGGYYSRHYEIFGLRLQGV